MQELLEFGVGVYDAKDWIEEKGIYDFNKMTMYNNMQNPNYINPLRLEEINP